LSKMADINITIKFDRASLLSSKYQINIIRNHRCHCQGNGNQAMMLVMTEQS
jgi:hypothetical protein